MSIFGVLLPLGGSMLCSFSVYKYPNKNPYVNLYGIYIARLNFIMFILNLVKFSIDNA